LVGDSWQPEAIENLAHGPADRQERFFAKVVATLRDAKAKGVVIDWEQIDPAYRKDITRFIDKFCDALHNDDKELWLTVQPGQDLDYIDFDELSDNVDRFVASLFDETSDIDPPGPLGSRPWFEGWLHVLLEGSDTKQWIITLGSYGYDWTIGGKKAELISFPEAMSRASNAEIASAEVSATGYNPYFYYEDNDKDHAVWFLDVVTLLNELREVRKQKAGGFALYRLGTEDTAIWDSLTVPADFTIDGATRPLLEVLRGTDTITDVGEGEIVTVDQSRADGTRPLEIDQDQYLTARYTKFPEFPTYYHPNLALCWPEHIRVELNATQLLIQSLTGRATTLFRPPYAADTQPSRLAELIPLQIAQDQDYMVVLENIDPQDWAKPGADVILQRIKQQRHDGSIVLLHDAGGNRSQTVQALPRIIDWLQTRGDTIVPLSMLLGTTRDALMPPLPGGQSMSHYISSTGFRVFHAFEEFLW